MIIKSLIWDDWNIDHIAGHGVNPEEVEEVCLGDKKTANKIGIDRIRVIGQTSDGRYLTIFIDRKEKQNFYTITARDATAKEKRYFKSRLK